MANDVRVTNFPNETSGSIARVGFDLMELVMSAEQKTRRTGDLAAGWSTADRAYILDLYSECRSAAAGNR